MLSTPTRPKWIDIVEHRQVNGSIDIMPLLVIAENGVLLLDRQDCTGWETDFDASQPCLRRVHLEEGQVVDFAGRDTAR